MSKPMQMPIASFHEQALTVADIQVLIHEGGGRITITYVLASVGRTNSYLDIIEDCLDASYIAEMLAERANAVTCRQVLEEHVLTCYIDVATNDSGGLAERIGAISTLFFAGQESEPGLLNYTKALLEYRDSLDRRIFACPELIDDYYSNLINGAYYELDFETDDEFLKREYATYPERRYGFWKSGYSGLLGDTIYSSGECLILPSGVEPMQALSTYLGFPSREIYSEAIFFSVGRNSYLSSESSLVHFPYGHLELAKQCLAVLSNGDSQRVELSDSILQTYSPVREYLEESSSSLLRPDPPLQLMLAKSGRTVLVVEEKFTFVLFPHLVKPSRTSAVFSEFWEVIKHLGVFARQEANLSLSWEELDADQFEELCYDILFRDDRFDSRTIRRMGKSRSRDGGRDIVVYTKSRPTHPSVQYIFQCKFTTPGTSLTTSKLRNIGDTILQYGSKGYGVMTNVLIDSTLYDRLDAICSRFKVEGDHWSGLEIERAILRDPILRERYFPNSEYVVRSATDADI